MKETIIVKFPDGKIKIFKDYKKAHKYVREYNEKLAEAENKIVYMSVIMEQ